MIYYDYMNLASIIILSIENDVTDNLNFEQKLKKFALQKATKKKFRIKHIKENLIIYLPVYLL